MTTTTTQSDVVANAQRVVISVTERGTTETIVQIGVPATTADYGVLIPTPAEPTLDSTPVSADALDSLDAETQPRIVTVSEEVEESSGCDCGLGSGGDDDDAAGPVGAGAGTKVTASEPVNIGPVTAVTLTATDATALNDWLDSNGFAIPDERQDLLQNYVGAGRYFIAVKRSDGTASGGPTSVGLHYTLQGDHRLLSLAFARLGAAPTVAFTLFVFAPTRALPSAPFQALSLDDLDAGLLLKNDYRGAVQKAVKAHGAQAFVLESGDTGLSRYLPSGLADPSALFVRMTTVLAADDLTEDAKFFGPAAGPIQHDRTIYTRTPVHASVGILGFVALAWGMRRQRRA